MADLPRYVIACLHTGKLAFLAIMVSAGIVLQVLACALYNNWWPMLTVIMYVLLPMPLLFFVGSDTSSLVSNDGNGWEELAHPTIGILGAVLNSFTDSKCSGRIWVDATKFLTGASAVGSIAIPIILKHANVIGWGAMIMELSSFFVLVSAIVCFLQMSNEDEYSML